MTYALNRRLFIEDGPVIQAANAAELRPAARFLAWRKLNPDHRLALVEGALTAPANDDEAGLAGRLWRW